MPWWEWLLEAAGLLVVLVLAYGAALVVRRRVLSRNGGTFELSHRLRRGRAGRGWLLGLGRYSGDELEWFRIFTLAIRPKRRWHRAALTYEARREPERVEQHVHYPGHLVIRCQGPDGEVELAMSAASLTGFQAWLEARPPGDGLVRLTARVAPPVRAARNAVVVVFALNGLLFATLVSRLPDLRATLELSNGALGLLLLVSAGGSVIALPSSGFLIQRSSAATVVRLGAVLTAAGLVVAALGAVLLSDVVVAAAGLFTYGIGTGVWDVAMNVEGAEVERRLARSIMPRFHAAWSFGSIAGAGVGVVSTAADISMLVHFVVLGAVSLLIALRETGAFLSPSEHPEPEQRAGSAWLEPRTIAIGVMVLSFAVVEGSANDWLSLALIDGYGVEPWVGVSGFALFVCAMTLGRLLGPILLDRFGRAPVLWATAASAAVGILLVVRGEHLVLVALGIVVWGLGGSLGFPVGMSAAADDPARAAARVSVVSTIGYGAFLAGPPLLGMLGDRVGTLDSLLVVAALMVPAVLAVFAARVTRGPDDGRSQT